MEKVISRVELLECNADETNILCIVDGEPDLFVKARNLIADTKYKERLTVQLDYPGKPPRLDIQTRRKRIAAAHNQARGLINHKDGHVLSVEDDTLVPRNALKNLMDVMITNRACASVEGVELGRWGVPYVGAWVADDIYKPERLTSIDNIYVLGNAFHETNIDAGGLFCTLIKADLYKQHTFTCDNGLGPDVNFGIENRQLGYENFIDWRVPCTHLTIEMGKEKKILASDTSRTVTMTKRNDVKWHISY